jgi:hypothetical protein
MLPCELITSSFLLISPEIVLQPAESSYNGTEHLKIAFIRSNEILQEGGIQVGGSRLYGGAILTRDSQYTDTWLKVNHECIQQT